MKKILSKISFFLVILMSFVAFFHPITTLNEDLGRHLLLGKIIIETKHVPTTNLLAYTFPNYLFINSHWLSEVISYSLFKLLGNVGLLLLTTGLGVAMFVFLFHYLYRCFGLFPSIITFLFTLLLFFQRTEVRPQIFSYFFTVIFILILYKNKQKPTKWLFILNPLAFLWVNLHIYFFLGPIFILLFLVDDFLQTRKQVNRLFLVFLGSIVVSFINPNFLQGAFFPLTFWRNYGLLVGENLNSFSAIFYRYPPVYLFFFVITVLLLLFIVFRKKIEPIDWLLSITLTIFGLIAVRDVPIFALTVVIPFTRLLFFSQKALISKKFAKYQTLFKFFQTILIFFLFISVFFIFLRQGLGFGAVENYKLGVDFFEKNHLKGPLFNDYDIGSYLDYRLYPQTRVFVDNRPEAYPASFFINTYLPMLQIKSIFYKVDKKYHFQSIIFSKTNMSQEAKVFLSWIRKDKQWMKVYEDQYMLILKRA